jgi:hypothetical protein
MPPVAPGSHRVGARHDTFPPFAFSRTKKVLFVNLLLNHMFYPLFARTRQWRVASLGKNSSLPLKPWPLFREKAIASLVSLAASPDNQQC